MFGPEKCWVLKNVGSQKLSSQQNFGFRKILVPQTILDHQKILVLKMFRSPKNFGSPKILVPQKFRFPKNFGSPKILGSEKLWVPKNFGS